MNSVLLNGPPTKTETRPIFQFEIEEVTYEIMDLDDLTNCSWTLRDQIFVFYETLGTYWCIFML